jgi:hypothetical protein
MQLAASSRSAATGAPRRRPDLFYSPGAFVNDVAHNRVAVTAIAGQRPLDGGSLIGCAATTVRASNVSCDRLNAGAQFATDLKVSGLRMVGNRIVSDDCPGTGWTPVMTRGRIDRAEPSTRR